jgi:hypothetical protein
MADVGAHIMLGACGREKIAALENPYIIGVFCRSKKFALSVAYSRAATRRMRRTRSSRRKMWWRRARDYARSSENAGVFVPL